MHESAGCQVRNVAVPSHQLRCKNLRMLDDVRSQARLRSEGDQLSERPHRTADAKSAQTSRTSRGLAPQLYQAAFI